MSSHESLTIERRDAVMLVTIDDGKANALSASLIAAVIEAIDNAEADPAVGAIVLAGRQGRFSGGFDLDVMMSGNPAAVVGLVSDGGELVRRLYGCNLPVVAACTGHAVAAGALMLLGCDVRIGPDAPVKIGLNEVTIGMVLPDWGLTIAAERLSRRHVQRSVLNGRLVDGAGAVEAGFLDVAVQPEDVVDRAIAEAATLAQLDRTAYAGTIAAFRQPILDRMETQIAADRSRIG